MKDPPCDGGGEEGVSRTSGTFSGLLILADGARPGKKTQDGGAYRMDHAFREE